MVWLWQQDPLQAGRALSPAPGQRWLTEGTLSPRPQVAGAWPVRPDGGMPHVQLPHTGNGFVTPPFNMGHASLPFPAAADPALLSPPRSRTPPHHSGDPSFGKGVMQHILPMGNGPVAHQESSPVGAFFGGPLKFSKQMSAPMQFMNVPSVAGHERQLVDVPVQSLSRPGLGAAIRSTTPPPHSRGDVTATGLLSKIGGILSDAERELCEEADAGAEQGNSPAMHWLDMKIQALQDRQTKRSEQQGHLSELRRMVGGGSSTSQQEAQRMVADALGGSSGLRTSLVGNSPPDVPIVFEEERMPLQQGMGNVTQADHAVLRHQVMQLRCQRKEFDREREELLRVRATLEADAETRLKDTQSVTEAIEAGERRAQVAEEAAWERIKEVEMRCQGFQEKLLATEMALQKERLISQEALDVQASAEADLTSVKDISHKVLGDCRALQVRIQELELERNDPHEAGARIWTLEQTCGQLQEDNANLRLQLEHTRAAVAQAAQLATPQRDEESVEQLAQQERILRLREELAFAEADVATGTSPCEAARPSRLQVPNLPDVTPKQSSSSAAEYKPAGSKSTSPEVTLTRPPSYFNTAPSSLQVPSSNSLARRESATRDRIKELEREMAAVHKDTLTLDGIQRMPRHTTTGIAEASAAGSPGSAKTHRRYSSGVDSRNSQATSDINSQAARQPRQASNGSFLQNNRRNMRPSASMPSVGDQLSLAGGLTAQMRELAAEWAAPENVYPAMAPLEDAQDYAVSA